MACLPPTLDRRQTYRNIYALYYVSVCIVSVGYAFILMAIKYCVCFAFVLFSEVLSAIR